MREFSLASISGVAQLALEEHSSPPPQGELSQWGARPLESSADWRARPFGELGQLDSSPKWELGQSILMELGQLAFLELGQSILMELGQLASHSS